MDPQVILDNLKPEIIRERIDANEAEHKALVVLLSAAQRIDKQRRKQEAVKASA